MSCRFCNCRTGHQHQPSCVTFLSTNSLSPARSESPTQNRQTDEQTQTTNFYTQSSTFHQPSKIYDRYGNRLGKQMTNGGGTTTESVVFPRGDAFMVRDGRKPSPNAKNDQPRGYVPANIVKNTSHRRFVQSLRAPTSYACAPHFGAGGGGSECMRREFPGPRVPNDLRQRESDLRLASKIHRNNSAHVRNAATRQRAAANAPNSPIAQKKQRPQSANGDAGRRRFDPPSSATAARVISETPISPAARDLMSASELGLRQHEPFVSYTDDGEEIIFEPQPGFRSGAVSAPLGYCPATDRRRGGGGGGGGGSSSSFGRSNNAAYYPPQMMSTGRSQTDAGIGCLSNSTIKPQQRYDDNYHGISNIASAANGIPLRRSGAMMNKQNKKGISSSVRSPADAAARNRSVTGAGIDADNSIRVGGGSSPARVHSQNARKSYTSQNPASAADVASWRRKYYPDGVYAVRRHFYSDPTNAAGNNPNANSGGSGVPVCDRCCCKCCCSSSCEHARHRPGSCSECLWWYS